MDTETFEISVSGIPVEVVRKRIKNLHLGVYPPHGRVRVAAPLAVSADAVRLAVIGKLGWVKRQRSHFHAQPRQSAREMVGGESHYFLGRRYRLRVIEKPGVSGIVLRNRSTMELFVSPGKTPIQRQAVLHRWYRDRLRELVTPLMCKWQPVLGVSAAAWGIRKMKTRWGSCNIEARRIWLNLELVKKPPGGLEYILVHELTHLLERHHNDRFVALMDRFLPDWRHQRNQLNAAPLPHEDWSY